MRVRVLLDSMQNNENFFWDFQSCQGFIIADSLTASKKMRCTAQKLSITFQHGSLYLNGKKYLKKQLVLSPYTDHLQFNGNNYQGEFIILIMTDRVLLINNVDLENYVAAVLRTEGWPGWPLEMYKVLAIACRTYVIAMIHEARELNRPYHIKNTNEHQTYAGLHRQDTLYKAALATHGLFLTYDKKPIVAMFDVCCGSVIPAHVTGFDFEKAPYLARPYACTYCKSCSSYAWQASFNYDEFLQQLQKEFPQLKTTRNLSLKITKKDRAGLVLEVVVKAGRTSITLSGKKLYSLLKKLRSFCFMIQKKGSTIMIKGRGHGHHIGLCQWGARAMVREGWDHQAILSFYYPETKLMRLRVTS